MATQRGWLRRDEGCNIADPDFHYDVIVDPDWLDRIGISPARLFRGRDVMNGQNHPKCTVVATNGRVYCTQPAIHIELQGIPRTPSRPYPIPSTWIEQPLRCAPDPRYHGGAPIYWPFDLFRPLDLWGEQHPNNLTGSLPDLLNGGYVRVRGGLVTDSPHWSDAEDSPNVGEIEALHLPFPNAYGTLFEQIWREDGDSQARWGEIHPPDIIAPVCKPKVGGQPDWFRQQTDTFVGVLAFGGLTGDKTLTVQLRLDASGAPVPGKARLVLQEFVPDELAGFTAEIDPVQVEYHHVQQWVSVTKKATFKTVSEIGTGPQIESVGRFFLFYRLLWDVSGPMIVEFLPAADGTFGWRGIRSAALVNFDWLEPTARAYALANSANGVPKAYNTGHLPQSDAFFLDEAKLASTTRVPVSVGDTIIMEVPTADGLKYALFFISQIEELGDGTENIATSYRWPLVRWM